MLIRLLHKIIGCEVTAIPPESDGSLITCHCGQLWEGQAAPWWFEGPETQPAVWVKVTR